MWPTSDLWSQLVAGDHSTATSGAAQYGGEITVESLPIVGGSWRQDYDGNRVRTAVDVTIQGTRDTWDATDGDLVPDDPTSPLAPFGQQMTLRQELAYGSAGESVPLGTFRIEPTDTSGTGWRPVRKRGRVVWVPKGGDLRVQGIDLWSQIVDANFTGPVQPAAGGTIRSEVSRICRGLVDVDSYSLPTRGVSGTSTVYSDNRADAIEALGALVGRVPFVGRDGLLRLADPTAGQVVWDVTVDTDEALPASPALSRDGIFNVVLAEGETGDSATVRGVATENSGPFAYTGPLGPRVYRFSSPLLATNAAAAAAANTRWRNLRTAREIQFSLRLPFNPALDCLDKLRATIRPRADRPLIVIGTVISNAWRFEGGSMEVTCSAPREAFA